MLGQIKNKKCMNARKKRDNIAGYLFVSPWLIGFFLLTLLPLVYSAYLSFTDYSVLRKANWIGLENFIKMFTEDKYFWISFKVTCKFALTQVPAKLIVSLLVAVVLAKASKMTGVYRLAFYVPSLLGGSVAVAMTWKQLWNGNGVINQFLEKMGVPTVNWLHNKDTALYILILLGVWQFGQQMLIFLAAIKGIPSSLQEAAIIDGAGPVKRFFSITLPMITPSLFFNLVNGIIGSMQAFGSAYLITNGGPMNSTLYYGLYQYRMGFQQLKMGYACAMAWFLMLVIVSLTALVFRSQSAWVYYEAE